MYDDEVDDVVLTEAQQQALRVEQIDCALGEAGHFAGVGGEILAYKVLGRCH